MTKPFALQNVLQMTQQRADEATQQLAQLIAAEQEAKNKLELLLDYREEYARHFQTAGAEGISPQQWRNFQLFLSRLDDAITQQQEMLNRAHRNTGTGQQAWKDQQVKLKALGTLSARHHNSESRRESKDEQKRIDEFAARGHQARDDS